MVIKSNWPRKVTVTKKFWNEKEKKIGELETREGWCHGFCSEGDSGEMCCVGIVEFLDGTINTYYVKDIQFVEPLPEE